MYVKERMKLNLNGINKCRSILIQIGSVFLHGQFGTMVATASKYSRLTSFKRGGGGGGGGGGAVGGSNQKSFRGRGLDMDVFWHSTPSV